MVRAKWEGKMERAGEAEVLKAEVCMDLELMEGADMEKGAETKGDNMDTEETAE